MYILAPKRLGCKCIGIEFGGFASSRRLNLDIQYFVRLATAINVCNYMISFTKAQEIKSATNFIVNNGAN